MLNLFFLLPNWNWSYIIIGGVTAVILFFTFLYTVLIGRKNTVIETLKESNETLKEKNKWLQEQLDLAKATTGDVLVDRLAKRSAHLESELEKLSTDFEANKELITVKEKELAETSDLWAQVGKELGRLNGQYGDLKRKYLCPTCEASLVELKDIHEGNWTGSQRSYECGFSELDGEMVTYCPADQNYPKFEEYELTVQKHIIGEGYTVYMHPKVHRPGMLHEKSSMGRTREDAINNLKEDYYRNPAFSQNENPPFEF